MNRRKRDSITIESPKNNNITSSNKNNTTDIKNENIYLINEAYGKLNEYPSPQNSNNNQIEDVLIIDNLFIQYR